MTSATAATLYDEFTGPAVDPARWIYLERPLPDGTTHRAAEPGARVQASEGKLSVSIDKFRTSHDTLQTVDSAKHLMVSTAEFSLPHCGTAVFEIQQSARLINAPNADHTLGIVTFNLIDFASGMVFDIGVGDRHVFAIHEQFASDPLAPTLFTHLVENPFLITTEPGQPHWLQITFDTANHVVRWAVDDSVIYHVDGAKMPDAVHIGLGMFTGVKLTENGSASLQGQGLHATWSAPTITIGG